MRLFVLQCRTYVNSKQKAGRSPPLNVELKIRITYSESLALPACPSSESADAHRRLLSTRRIHGRYESIRTRHRRALPSSLSRAPIGSVRTGRNDGAT